MERKASQSKTNGHDSGAAKANGHGALPPSLRAPLRGAPLALGKAASDDARDFPSAAAAHSAVAGKEREACAEVAKPSEGGSPKSPKKQNRSGEEEMPAKSKEGSGQVDIPPGSEPLPADGPGFVDAMHAHVDLYLACARLVKSEDEKIAQRMVERLLEMSYGKSPAAPGEEASEFGKEVEHPIGQSAAEGAKV